MANFTRTEFPADFLGPDIKPNFHKTSFYMWYGVIFRNKNLMGSRFNINLFK